MYCVQAQPCTRVFLHLSGWSHQVGRTQGPRAPESAWPGVAACLRSLWGSFSAKCLLPSFAQFSVGSFAFSSLIRGPHSFLSPTLSRPSWLFVWQVVLNLMWVDLSNFYGVCSFGSYLRNSLLPGGHRGIFKSELPRNSPICLPFTWKEALHTDPHLLCVCVCV